MPNIAYGNDNSADSSNLKSVSGKYDYDYPAKLRLDPGSKLHQYIIDQVMRRARASADIMSSRFPAWNKIDETMTAYIDVDEAENTVTDDDHRKPTSIIFPYSYAILETILGYLLSAYMQSPIFRYVGQSPNDTIGAILLEKVIDIHTEKSKMILNFHTQFRDALCYGFGAVGTGWDVQTGFRVGQETIKRFFSADEIVKTKESFTLYEGNKLFNIDPYLTLPDPNTPIGNAQKGEFFGWVSHDNLMNLLTEELNGDYFNVKYLKHLKNRKTSIYGDDQSGRNTKTGTTKSLNDTDLNPVDLITFNIKLIPKDWKLGKSEDPQLWQFVIASDILVIQAKPLEYVHNQIPVGICAPDFDGYSISPVSRMEILYGLQHTLDWMINAHVANVRKAVNDTLIVDPYWININDLKTPKAGGIVRTRKQAWGKGVAGAIQQLQINDVTRGHMADSEIIKSAMDRISGTDGSMQGALRQAGPDRLTGAEFKGTQAGGLVRMERIARLIGVQSFQDIGYQFAANAQQFMSEDLWIKTTGDWRELLAQTYGPERARVRPNDLLVNYDLKVRDGTIPGGNFSGVWAQLFEIISNNQQLQKDFDLTKIFMHIAENNGAKNVHDFIRIVPDAQVAQDMAAGNIVPAQSNQIPGGM